LLYSNTIAYYSKKSSKYPFVDMVASLICKDLIVIKIIDTVKCTSLLFQWVNNSIKSHLGTLHNFLIVVKILDTVKCTSLLFHLVITQKIIKHSNWLIWFQALPAKIKLRWKCFAVFKHTSLLFQFKKCLQNTINLLIFFKYNAWEFYYDYNTGYNQMH